MVGIPSLHQVTAIHLASSVISTVDLEALQQLPQLKELSLTLDEHEDPLGVAAAWHNLPLCALQILDMNLPGDWLQQMMPHVAAATRLTKLEFSIDQVERGATEVGRLAICEHLKGLEEPQRPDS